MMTEIVVPATKARTINIDSAIHRSSYQLPLFVALSVEGGEAQVVKTFETARDVFDHVFSVMLDRLRQSRAVEKVEKLVPASANLNGSASTEYVLVVRGKAIFWFSSAAAKRAAGRRLLLEHARELADAERAPFYVLNTRVRMIRVAVVALAVGAGTAVALALSQFSVRWPVVAPGPVAATDTGDREFATGGNARSPSQTHREPIANFDVTAGETLGREAFLDVRPDMAGPVPRPAPISRRQQVIASDALVLAPATGRGRELPTPARPNRPTPEGHGGRGGRSATGPTPSAPAAPAGRSRPT